MPLLIFLGGEEKRASPVPRLPLGTHVAAVCMHRRLSYDDACFHSPDNVLITKEFRANSSLTLLWCVVFLSLLLC